MFVIYCFQQTVDKWCNQKFALRLKKLLDFREIYLRRPFNVFQCDLLFNCIEHFLQLKLESSVSYSFFEGLNQF